jgi:RNA polymerase sigma factor (TIGR02999 family)
MTVEPGEITRLLLLWRDGDRGAENQLFELVGPRLRKMASSYLSRERKGTILQPSALVNEMYLRLHGTKIDWSDRAHFFAFAGRAMRRYLIDVARRGRITSVPIDLVQEPGAPQGVALDLAIEIDRLLDELAVSNHGLCVAVELKFFLALTDEEAADALQCSRSTFQRQWKDARKWLFRALEGKHARHA